MPRFVAPRYSWVPPHASTNGDIAAEVGEQLGVVPDAEQRLILDAVYAENERGDLACFEVGVCAPRQNLKTVALEIAALTDLFVFGEPLHIWTAHEFTASQGSFEHMVQMVESNDDFRSRCRKPRTANGDEAIELLSGERIEFHARTKGGGRSKSAPRVTLDEALHLGGASIGALLPTLATFPNAQVRYASSAGKPESAILRAVRDRGRAGNDPSLAWYEWGAPVTPCADADCSHVLGVEGCSLDRVDLLKLANPAYGRRITAKKLADFRRAMPPEEFAREFLGWWEDPIDGADGRLAQAWADLEDRGAIAGRPTFAVDVSPGRMSTSIALCGGRDDGRAQVELVSRRPGVSGVIGRLAEMTARHHAPVVVDPSSDAGSLIPELEAARVDVVQVSGREFAQACGSFHDAVINGKIAHLGDLALTSALAGAKQKDYGDGAWRWSRRSSSTDISPLVAVTLAHHGFAVHGAASVYESRGVIEL